MDKKPEKLVPEVRFKGFTDDWEQHKLGKVSKIVRGASPRPIKDPKWFEKDSHVGWIRISDVTEQNGRIRHLTQHLSKAGETKTRVLEQPHLLLSIAASVGFPAINYVPIGVHDGFLIFLNSKFNIDYMFYWLEKFRPLWRKYGQPGSQINLNSDIVSNTRLALPKEAEQSKVSNFLNKVELLITLQQRKLEQLKQLKKAILQIIASNRLLLHTKKVDMIKVRVADTYKITRGNVLARSEISNVRTSKYPYPVYSSQTKNHGLMGYYKDFLFKNAITWTTDGANAGTVKYRKGRFYSTNVNGVLLSSEGLANQLTAELLNLVAFKYVSHVGNPKLMNNTMGEILFNIPKSVETQQYFSDCIESVINLIGKQEKATDKLNRLKKYLLQKLFI